VGAGNQQERLSHTEEAKHFLAGFIEGEGALCVSIKQHATSRFGYLVDPEFFLYQHESGRRVLELAREIFGTGAIVPKSGSPKVLVYVIHSQRSLVEKVIPFFERYVVPFSCKRATFERFREIVEMLERKEHLIAESLIRIVEKAYAMNPDSKGRQRLRTLEEVCERILRGHTPNIPPAG
jgi:LAGLIDADG endonuclease